MTLAKDELVKTFQNLKFAKDELVIYPHREYWDKGCITEYRYKVENDERVSLKFMPNGELIFNFAAWTINFKDDTLSIKYYKRYLSPYESDVIRDESTTRMLTIQGQQVTAAKLKETDTQGSTNWGSGLKEITSEDDMIEDFEWQESVCKDALKAVKLLNGIPVTANEESRDYPHRLFKEVVTKEAEPAYLCNIIEGYLGIK